MSERLAVQGWKRSNLLSLAEYHNGAAFNPSHWGEEGLPIIRIEQINDPSAPTDYYTGPLIPQNFVTTGDLIFSWSATLKAVLWKSGDGALNQHLFKVVPKKGTNKAFLKYVLEDNMERISSGSQGSTMKHITRRELHRYYVEVPMREVEQRRIAEILSTVDEAIEQTEALIAKYQQIKAGLMHDLFTRGVTPDGNLRPTRAEAPHLYKESPLGWIPKEWFFGFLSEYLLGGPKNGYSPQEVDQWSGLYALGLGCLTADGFKPNQIKVVATGSSQCRDALLQNGDLLLSRSNTRELVGLCGIYCNIGNPCIYPDLMMRIRPSARTSGEFLEALLLSPLMRRRISGAAVGTSGSMEKLNSRAVLRLELAMPEKDEQAYMLEFIRTSREVLASLKCDLSKLCQLKHGLMHDLLTGRMRVKAEEVASRG